MYQLPLNSCLAC